MGMTIDDVRHCLKVMVDCEVCEECRLYGTTGTDHCEHDCVIEALNYINKYQMFQTKYVERLKADLVAMLTEIQLEIEEMAKDAHTNAFMNGYKDMYINGISASAIKCSEVIQQKINALKEQNNG